ncbi:GroES-like protein [Eremomyces bilateralis CBS 781.70]|uniref:GroES-like protein n=1 Tax=Eremomyces bilateralis CBS 781.70 TaxID=1392243 RepID=A0A6G1FTC0_9PEZI|nr:GroES-like protein [Eremomyces bilateralis CBS 781.70]KAF1808958.1 GroES-like protein [Eremomyces bilateralis CBS 781.70]
MKGITLEKPGAPWVLVDDLPVPEPGDSQILVKSIVTAINPIDGVQAATGLLVEGWPFTPGCDAGGIVVKAGKNAVSALGSPFKEGDRICGATRLGTKGHSPFQEYFLMDAQVTIPVPSNLSYEHAACVGVAVETAGLGVFSGLHVPIFDPKNLPAPNGEWALVLGGASSVGKMALQLLKKAGYKVIVTCSSGSAELLKSLGAEATVDYKKPKSEVISEILSITGNSVARVFDAVSQHVQFAADLLKGVEKSPRYFTSTNGRDPIPDDAPYEGGPILLGPVGRPEGTETNGRIEAFIPLVYKLLEAGELIPSEYIVGGTGFESIVDAYQLQSSGKGGNKKVIVKLQDP